MIVNRTSEFKRNNNFVNTNNYLDISHIRISISDIEKIIRILRIKQEKYKLPSFENKNKKKIEIFKYSEIIKDKLNDLNKEIEDIDTNDLNLKKNIINYFNIKSKIVMLDFKQVQQEFLDYSCNILDESIKNDYNFYNDNNLEKAQEINNINEIKKNIYDISNLILKMRIVIEQGSFFIDRLDVNYNNTINNTENLNKELELMVNRYKSIKDKIMILLIVVVSILTFLSVIKYEHKHLTKF